MEMEDEKRKLKEALLRKATGYEYEEKEIVLDRNGNSTGKIKVTRKQVPPNLEAIIIIKNMIDSGKW